MIVCIVDTSVFCELLNVPGLASHDSLVVDEFEAKQSEGHQFVLPLAAIIETGNHIAHVPDGAQRRSAAERFAKVVIDSIDGKTPFAPASQMPSIDDVRVWIAHFVDDATRGMGIADRSIISLWETLRRQHPKGRVYIWSLDEHLSSYDTE
ncbi:hypothetical protein [Sandaracinus amylolyticus]|uniref:PIN domain-containing protein n=1 Tax=Sandaracinus amylolyticus TaxID=927083 RepID=A0A0F6SHS9_9BACT|nr:hypothetical protein [Sandaracinus amylolyticus]AKF10974.1 hypothetical protein DB32_008123 [Sandaracinus amylolyticus]